MNEEDETFHKLGAESEHVDSSHSEQEIKHREPRDHSSNLLHTEIVRNPTYRSTPLSIPGCVPLRERIGNWFASTFRCSSSEASYVEKLDEVERKHPVTVTEEYRKLFADKIMKIRIIETSRMQLDSNVIHPFVKLVPSYAESTSSTRTPAATCRRTSNRGSL